MPAAGGPAVQVTRHGGSNAFESADERFLYYWNHEAFWRMPLEGGEETRVIEGIGEFDGWRVLAGGICLVNTRATPAELRFLDFATNHVRLVSRVDLGISAPGGGAFTVSPDGKWVLYGRVDALDSDIMLLENFH